MGIRRITVLLAICASAVMAGCMSETLADTDSQQSSSAASTEAASSLDPTQQQQTVEAAVDLYFTQTAAAIDALAGTQAVEAAFNQALTATAGYQATIDAEFATRLTATAIFDIDRRDYWIWTWDRDNQLLGAINLNGEKSNLAVSLASSSPPPLYRLSANTALLLGEDDDGQGVWLVTSTSAQRILSDTGDLVLMDYAFPYVALAAPYRTNEGIPAVIINILDQTVESTDKGVWTSFDNGAFTEDDQFFVYTGYEDGYGNKGFIQVRDLKTGIERTIHYIEQGSYRSNASGTMWLYRFQDSETGTFGTQLIMSDGREIELSGEEAGATFWSFAADYLYGQTPDCGVECELWVVDPDNLETFANYELPDHSQIHWIEAMPNGDYLATGIFNGEAQGRLAILSGETALKLLDGFVANQMSTDTGVLLVALADPEGGLRILDVHTLDVVYERPEASNYSVGAYSSLGGAGLSIPGRDSVSIVYVSAIDRIVAIEDLFAILPDGRVIIQSRDPRQYILKDLQSGQTQVIYTLDADNRLQLISDRDSRTSYDWRDYDIDVAPVALPTATVASVSSPIPPSRPAVTRTPLPTFTSTPQPASSLVPVSMTPSTQLTPPSSIELTATALVGG